MLACRLQMPLEIVAQHLQTETGAVRAAKPGYPERSKRAWGLSQLKMLNLPSAVRSRSAGKGGKH